MSDDVQFLADFVRRSFYEPGSVTEEDRVRLSDLAHGKARETSKTKETKETKP